MSSLAPVRIREARPSELTHWDALVAHFANHRVTHTTAWLRSLEASGLGRPLYLIFHREDEVVGCLPGMLVTIGPLRIFGSPLPGWQTVSMGPAFDPARASTKELLLSLTAFLEDRYKVHHVEILSADLDPAAMEALGFRGEQMVTYRAVLQPTDEARTFRAMKESARRNVRRGERLGLVVRFEDDDEFIAEHYAQIEEVFARGGNVVPFRRQRLETFVQHMRAGGCLAAVSAFLPDGRTRAATGTFTIANGELVLWMWAHRTSLRWYRATELMTWTVMQHAMAAGCTSVDFMGRGDFKAVFGAVPDDTKYRWVRSRVPALTSVRDALQQVFRWQQRARGRVARLRLELSGASMAGATGAGVATGAPEAAVPCRPSHGSGIVSASLTLRALTRFIGGSNGL